MKVSVVYALPEEQVWLPLEVDEQDTVMNAIHLSGILTMFPSIELNQLKVGIFGKLTKLDSQLQEGDRVEIYRPITWKNNENESDG